MPYGQLSHRHRSSSSFAHRAHTAIRAGRAIGKTLHAVHKGYKKFRKGAKAAPARAITQALDNVSQHNDMSISNMHIKSGRKAHTGHKQYSRIMHQKAGFVRSSGSGVQAVKELFMAFTLQNLLQTTGSNPPLTAGIGTDDWPIGPFALNPYQTMTGSTYLLTGYQPSFDKTFIHNLKGEIGIANELSTPAEVDIYFAVFKRDLSIDDGPVAEWQRMLNDQATGTVPSFAVQRANGTTNISPTSGAAFAETYGQSPFTLKGWHDQFRLVGKHKFILGGGCSKKIRWNYEVNKMLDKQLLLNLQASNARPAVMHGLTLVPFVIARGSPVWDASNATTRMATTSSVSLIYTVSMQCNVSYPAPTSNTRGSVQVTDANFGFHPIANCANEKLLNDVDVVASNVRADV